MEKAIKKAIEGGWRPWDSLNHKRMENPNEIEDCPSVEAIDFIFERFPRGGKDHALQLYAKILMDSLFWQALGKEKKWPPAHFCRKHGNACKPIKQKCWVNYWHDFIDHLAEGKDTDSFFDKLLTN